jgi:hypothetical protein
MNKLLILFQLLAPPLLIVIGTILVVVAAYDSNTMGMAGWAAVVLSQIQIIYMRDHPRPPPTWGSGY